LVAESGYNPTEDKTGASDYNIQGFGRCQSGIGEEDKVVGRRGKTSIGMGVNLGPT
jgi:hypothetical protein